MIRIGVDFGGTKIEAAALDADGRFQARVRAPSPATYGEGLGVVAELVAEAERQAGASVTRIGLGTPGSLSPASGLIRNANSTRLNGQPFKTDLERVLKRQVRMVNDASCLALSEATDGAGAGHPVVFAVNIGTGCGGGVVVDGKLLDGRNLVAGEWGHTPLPWPRPSEYPGPVCWCGRRGCLEVWISGPGFAEDARAESGLEAITAARQGSAAEAAAFDRYVSRLARGLAVICDVLDPNVIVLGGGMSNIEELYPRLPGEIAPHVFSDIFETPVVRARHGDSSGVRGAAWLWPLDP